MNSHTIIQKNRKRFGIDSRMNVFALCEIHLWTGLSSVDYAVSNGAQSFAYVSSK